MWPNRKNQNKAYVIVTPTVTNTPIIATKNNFLVFYKIYHVISIFIVPERIIQIFVKHAGRISNGEIMFG